MWFRLLPRVPNEPQDESSILSEGANASVAQLVRAPASYAGGCGFESHRWYQGFGKDSLLLGVVAQ